MSIVTLKRKTEARYFPHSVNGVGFSLNGTTRFLGVGESLGRSVTRTPFKGTAPVGHGGGAKCRVLGILGRASRCDSVNEYPIKIIRSCSGQCVEQSVKPSAINYRIKYQSDAAQLCANWVKQSGSLDSSELLRVCVAVDKDGKKTLVPDKQLTTPPCSNAPVVYTKSAPGPDPYDFFYMKKGWKTRACAVPSWPPRVLNSFCAPVYFRPTNSQ